MLVRFVGFSMSTTGPLSVNNLLVALSNQKITSDQFKGAGRFIFIDTKTDKKYYLGLIVTVKDQRKFCELDTQKESFQVVVNNLADESHLMEFNFFVVNKVSGTGLYQHYHQSCSLGQAMGLLKKRYNAIKQNNIDDARHRLLKSGKPERKAEREAKKTHKGYFRWEMLVRKEQLNDILNDLAEIKKFEMDIAFLEPDEKEFGPLTGLVKKQRRRFTFEPKNNVAKVASAISSVVNTKKPAKGRIQGVDEDGMERIIRLQDNPDNFGEFDYDEVAPHINGLDVGEFQGSWVIEELIKKCDDYNHIFESEIK